MDSFVHLLLPKGHVDAQKELFIFTISFNMLGKSEAISVSDCSQHSAEQPLCSVHFHLGRTQQLNTGFALKVASREHHVPRQVKLSLCCSIMSPFGLIKLGFHLYILTSYLQEELIFLPSAAMSQLAPWRLVYGLSSNGPSSHFFSSRSCVVMYLHLL